MRCTSSILFVLLLAGAAPALAQGVEKTPAPGGRGTCELLPGAREANRLVLGDGRAMVFISGPAEFVCPGGTTVKADSAVGVPDDGEFEFIGNVYYADTLKTLTTDWARYNRPDARLFARGNVVLTDKESGSVIRGPEMEYQRETPDRPEARAVVRGRPHATLYERPKSREAAVASTADTAGAAADPVATLPDTLPVAVDTQSVAVASPPPADGGVVRPASPMEVDADRMEILGNRLFHAEGRVEIVRDSTRAWGESADYDQEAGTLVLVGEARVEGTEFTLSADRIDGRLLDGELHEVFARRQAVLTGEDLRVDAPDLRVYFDAGEVNRLVAVMDSSAGDRPVAVSREFTLVADSIDAIAPGQELERIVAVGSAYGERVADSLAAGLPEAVSRDWLRGDTITGYFTREPLPEEKSAEPPAVEGDTAKTRSTLERLVAVGPEGRARSLYRIREEGDATGRPSVNYLVANRITLVMRGGEVQSVEAEGPIEGIHLQPESAPAEEQPPAPSVAPSGSSGGR
jgi:hypothetical protein